MRAAFSCTQKTPAVQNENPLFFTGDSSDPIAIETTWIFTGRHQNIPRFAIYKSQHRGSIYDSQYPNVDQFFTDAAKNEGRIFMMLRYIREYRNGLIPKVFKNEGFEIRGRNSEQ